MTNPSVRVSADVTAVQNELLKVQSTAQKINQTLNSGQVGIDAKEAKADLAALESSAAELVKLLDSVRNSGEELAGVDFGAVTDALDEAAKAATQLDQVLDAVGQSSGMSATVRNAKQTADHIQRAARAQEILGREGVRMSRQQAEAAKKQFDQWRQSGARGTSRIRNQEFDDWLSGGWRNYSMDGQEALRHRSRVLESVGVNVPEAAQPDAGGAGGRRPPGGKWSRVASMAGGFAAGAMSGGGMGIGAAMGGLAGMIPGAGMFLGPIAGAFGGMLDQGMQRAGSEGADLTDLRRMLGATKVDFEQLRGSVRYFTEGLGIAYNESAKLARTFAHTAGNAENLDVGREVGSAAGFARGYGMAPDAATQFFATMRHFGQTSDDRGNRRLALQIGEAVQRGGTSAKMDEVLASIQSFVQNSTRMSMTQASAEAYASFMSSLTGSNAFGMKGDPANAANVMNKADAAMRQGGMFGEGSRNVSLAAYQEAFGPTFNAFDAKAIQEQGAFNDLGQSFDNLIGLAQARGDTAEVERLKGLAKKGSGKNALSLNMDFIEKKFGGMSATDFALSGANHFGMGVNEFSELYQAYKRNGGLGGLTDTLKGAGVDVDKLNTKQVGVMAELATGDDEVLRKQASKLMGLKGSDALSRGAGSEAERLEKALAGGSTDELRKVVLKLTETHDTTKDQGEQMRKLQADMSIAMQKLATELIPLTLKIKDSIVAMVEKIAPDSDFVKQQRYEGEQRRAGEDSAKKTVEGYDHNLKLLRDQLGNETDPERKKALESSIKSLEGQRNDAVNRAKSLVTFDSSKSFSEWANGQQTSDGSVPQTAIPPVRTGSRMAGAASGRSATAEEIAATKKTVSDAADAAKMTPEQKAAFLAMAEKESGFNPNALGPVIEKGMHKGDRAQGVFQYMPKTAAGKGIDITSTEAQARQAAKDFKRIADRNGINQALVAHHAGEGAVRADGSIPSTSDGLSSTADYVRDIRKKADFYGGKVPGIAKSDDSEFDRKSPNGVAPGLMPTAAAQRQDLRIDHRVTLYDPQGNERGDAVVQTRVGSPMPAGVAV